MQGLQQHSRHTEGCWKTKADKEDKKCRYDFPRECHEEDKIIYEHLETKAGSRTLLKVAPRRPKGNENTNPYCALLLPRLRCNMDFKVIASPDIAINYLLKYVTKDEKPSTYLETLGDIVSSVKPDASNFGFVQSMVTKVIGKRDMSDQEVACLNDQNDLVVTNLNFFTVTLGEEVTLQRKLNSKTKYQKYLERMKCKGAEKITVEVVTFSGRKRTKRLIDVSLVEFYTKYQDITHNGTRLEKRTNTQQLVFIDSP